ncbi:hypothetical protein ARMSODRAFT_1014845 [Armillaria solidipes]|uniref:Putative collagen-binding domain-containing protein n=1 Tax=Armillaria solidipes TaxID=1076256 RepID=A0A2H3BUI9_9AGAR|nr:hypothetical protein ARMSODRAFT_1014845 [Armillaria solidipes]
MLHRRVSAARDVDGMWIAVYAPTGEAFGADMSVLAADGDAIGRWYNTRAGTYEVIGQVEITPNLTVIRPTSGGIEMDWVWLVEFYPWSLSVPDLKEIHRSFVIWNTLYLREYGTLYYLSIAMNDAHRPCSAMGQALPPETGTDHRPTFANNGHKTENPLQIRVRILSVKTYGEINHYTVRIAVWS